MATVTAYLLNPDGTKSAVSVEVESQDGIYFKKTEYNTPVYVGDNVVWVKNYFETVASKVIETTGATGRVFVTPSQKSDLNSLISAFVRQGQSQLWLEGTDTVLLKYHHAAQGVDYTVATREWTTDYITGNSTGQLNLDNRLQVLEAIFDGISDADEIINKWHELEAFLSGITETETLTGVIADALDGLKRNDNTWLGTQTFHITKLSDNYGNKVTIQAVGGSSSGTDTGLIRFPYEEGVVALEHNVPSIQLGPSFSGTPKAGDVWIRY